MSRATGPDGAPPPPPTTRPADVDTGVGLWLAALPLMVIGYVVNTVLTAPDDRAAALLTYALTAVVVVALSAMTIAFALLLRHGYRWTRTLLSGGGAAAVVVSVTNLLAADAAPLPAMVLAVCAIFGSVLVIGGLVVLHRKDATAFLVR